MSVLSQGIRYFEATPRETLMSGNCVAKFGGSGASWSLPSGNVESLAVAIEVRLTAEPLSNGREQLITHAEVQGELRSDFPVILSVERPCGTFSDEMKFVVDDLSRRD